MVEKKSEKVTPAKKASVVKPVVAKVAAVVAAPVAEEPEVPGESKNQRRKR